MIASSNARGAAYTGERPMPDSVAVVKHEEIGTANDSLGVAIR
jgi:hypothetical protein